jgi:hypothetical protein
MRKEVDNRIIAFNTFLIFGMSDIPLKLAPCTHVLVAEAS